MLAYPVLHFHCEILICKRFIHSYHENIVEDFKTSRVGQWYSKLKRMSGVDNNRQTDLPIEIPTWSLKNNNGV